MENKRENYVVPTVHTVKLKTEHRIMEYPISYIGKVVTDDPTIVED